MGEEERPMKTILEFDNDERVEAEIAMRSMRLLCALNDIDELARSCLKYDGDPLPTLERIREGVRAALEGLQ
jgi:hypothetical protein